MVKGRLDAGLVDCVHIELAREGHCFVVEVGKALK